MKAVVVCFVLAACVAVAAAAQKPGGDDTADGGKMTVIDNNNVLHQTGGKKQASASDDDTDSGAGEVGEIEERRTKQLKEKLVKQSAEERQKGMRSTLRLKAKEVSSKRNSAHEATAKKLLSEMRAKKRAQHAAKRAERSRKHKRARQEKVRKASRKEKHKKQVAKAKAAAEAASKGHAARARESTKKAEAAAKGERRSEEEQKQRKKVEHERHAKRAERRHKKHERHARARRERHRKRKFTGLCTFSSTTTCPSGWRGYGTSGAIMLNGHYHMNPFARGGGFNGGWTWTHPYLCCAEDATPYAGSMFVMARNCPHGTTSKGLFGIIMNNQQYGNNPFHGGGDFNGGWRWSHPYVCQADNVERLHGICLLGRPSCPQGWNDHGLVGVLLHNNDYSRNPFRHGGQFNEGWRWTHPSICCR